jgi:hypothetical protein
METKTDLKKYASKALKEFTSKKRANGESFWCLKDGKNKKWVQDMIQKAHCGMLPDDYKYQFAYESLLAIADTDNADDITLESDIYNSDLLQWVSSNLTRSEYVNEAVSEYGLDIKDFDLYKVLSMGQYMEKQEVLGIVRNELEKMGV